MISGVGLASARISGRGAMFATISGLSTPAGRQSEEHIRACDDLGERAQRRVLREARLVLVHQLGAAFDRRRPRCRSTQMFSRRTPSSTSSSRQASAAAPAPLHDQLDRSISLPTTLRPLRTAAPTMIAVPCWSSWKTGIFMRLAQLALDVEALRRLDVLEIDATERRLERGDDLDELVRIALVDLDVEDIDAGELLEQHGLAFHDRLRRQRADRAEPEHGGAVGDHADQIAARGVAERLRRDRRRSRRTPRRRRANRRAPGRAGSSAAWSA